MIYICSNKGKIDKLWGRFIKHILQMQNEGISVEYIRKGEVILNGKRYEPFYRENTMSYDPIGWKYEDGQPYIVFMGYDIQPLITYLKNKTLDSQLKPCTSSECPFQGGKCAINGCGGYEE